MVTCDIEELQSMTLCLLQWCANAVSQRGWATGNYSISLRWVATRLAIMMCHSVAQADKDGAVPSLFPVDSRFLSWKYSAWDISSLS